MSVPIPLYVETSLAKEPQVAPNTIPFLSYGGFVPLVF